MANRLSTVAQKLLRTAQAIALCGVVLIAAFTALPAAAEVPFTPTLHAFVHSMYPRMLVFQWQPCNGCDFYQWRWGENGGAEQQTKFSAGGQRRNETQELQLGSTANTWVFRVQACNDASFLGSSECSPWASTDQSRVPWPPLPAPPPSAAELAAQRRQEQIRQALAPTQGTSTNQAPYSLTVSPAVLSPATSQGFFARMPIPIKLAPPKGWNVTTYMVALQTKDGKGNWLTYTTMPVAAALAQTVGGYTGFGAGAPASLQSTAGSWRMTAQALSPQLSGWSNWTEFTVWQSPVSTTVQKPGLPPLAKPPSLAR